MTNYKPGDTFLLDEYESELCVTNQAVVTEVTEEVIHWKCETIFGGWKHSGTLIKLMHAST
jgi:hypothetical protein